MRLLKADRADDFVFEEFYDHNVPPYAILSHTWSRTPTEEVSYLDIIRGTLNTKPAYEKVRAVLLQAEDDGFKYCWVDTCCIDKSSSAELSEAINSMFRWYENAGRCYTFLEDVSMETVANSPDPEILVQELLKSRWFTRGWTLQELLAPRDVHFYSKEWLESASNSRIRPKQSFGSKITLCSTIAVITGIDKDILEGKQDIRSASVAQRMSWAAYRETSRLEDEAYCLMGLFDVNMPMLYGEGRKAFIRLQEEIIKQSDDETIFTWRFPTDAISPNTLHGLLADSPSLFAESGKFIPCQSEFLNERGDQTSVENPTSSTWTMTNRGLSLRLPVLRNIAALRCHDPAVVGFIGIRLRNLKHNQYARIECSQFETVYKTVKPEQIFVPQIVVEGAPVATPRRVAILLKEVQFTTVKSRVDLRKSDYVLQDAVFFGDQLSSRNLSEPRWTQIPDVSDNNTVPFAALLFWSPHHTTRFILFLGLSPPHTGPEELYFSVLDTPSGRGLGSFSSYLPITEWHETNDKFRGRWMQLDGKSFSGVSVFAVPYSVPGGQCFEIEVAVHISANALSDFSPNDRAPIEYKSKSLMAKLRGSKKNGTAER